MKSIAVILAGGKSERAGILKGLRLYKGKFWLDEQILRLKDIGFTEIHIGLGFGHQDYINSCKELNHAYIHINQNPNFGPFSTLKTVLKNIKTDYEKIIMFHVDRPIPKASTLKLLDKRQINDVLKLRFNNQSAHPIVFSKNLTHQLLEKADSENLRQILRVLPNEKVSYIDVDDSLTQLNLNLPEEWKHFIKNDT